MLFPQNFMMWHIHTACHCCWSWDRRPPDPLWFGTIVYEMIGVANKKPEVSRSDIILIYIYILIKFDQLFILNYIKQPQHNWAHTSGILVGSSLLHACEAGACALWARNFAASRAASWRSAAKALHRGLGPSYAEDRSHPLKFCLFFFFFWISLYIYIII